MEQQLDTTYLRPSFVSKALALSIVALGVGAAILLASIGVSFLWRPLTTTMDVKIKNPELTVTQSAPFVLKLPIPDDEIGARDLSRHANASNDERAASEVIQKEVVVFVTVNHDQGSVVTGWKFPNGSGQIPSAQFCYFTAPNSDRSSTRIDLAVDGRPVTALATTNVPDLEQARSKCRWWHA
jgi:hypothetical protein